LGLQAAAAVWSRGGIKKAGVAFKGGHRDLGVRAVGHTGECHGEDHGRRPVRERRVREEGEGADRWGRAPRERSGRSLGQVREGGRARGRERAAEGGLGRTWDCCGPREEG